MTLPLYIYIYDSPSLSLYKSLVSSTLISSRAIPQVRGSNPAPQARRGAPASRISLGRSTGGGSGARWDADVSEVLGTCLWGGKEVQELRPPGLNDYTLVVFDSPKHMKCARVLHVFSMCSAVWLSRVEAGHARKHRGEPSLDYDSYDDFLDGIAQSHQL